jgi:hypothetical protein
MASAPAGPPESVEVCALEVLGVFQSVPQDTIHADVHEPDDPERRRRLTASDKTAHDQDRWEQVGVEHVGGDGSDSRIRQVAECPDVWRQEQHGDQSSRGAIPRIEKVGKSKQYRSLQPKEEFSKSAHAPIAGAISLGPHRSPSTLTSA